MEICSRCVSADTSNSHNQALIDDLLFFEAWKNARVPWSIAAHVVRRVRQIRRANSAIGNGSHAQQCESAST